MTQPGGKASPTHQADQLRRVTEAARIEAIMCAATEIFLRDGYGQATVDRVAAEAVVSSRTIYERYKSKAGLLEAVVMRLLNRKTTLTSSADLDHLEPAAAFKVIVNELIAGARNAESATLFRLVTAEAIRFPALGARMRQYYKGGIGSTLADYLRRQARRGSLRISDPDRAASILLHMIFGEVHESWLFGREDAWAKLNIPAYIDCLIDLFLNGAVPRNVHDFYTEESTRDVIA